MADAAIDQLRRSVRDRARAVDPPYPTQIELHLEALLARYVERLADQALAADTQLDCMVTGLRAT